jgi:UDP-glucose 4-epimerase
VRQVIESVERVSGRKVPYRMAGRRAGDPAALVAASGKLRADTGWAPRYGALDTIIAHALAWREAHPHGYGDT